MYDAPLSCLLRYRPLAYRKLKNTLKGARFYNVIGLFIKLIEMVSHVEVTVKKRSRDCRKIYLFK
jgi:hypothetical protein